MRISSHNFVHGYTSSHSENILRDFFTIRIVIRNNLHLIKFLPETEKHIIHDVNADDVIHQGIECNIFSKDESKRNQDAAIQNQHNPADCHVLKDLTV